MERLSRASPGFARRLCVAWPVAAMGSRRLLLRAKPQLELGLREERGFARWQEPEAARAGKADLFDRSPPVRSHQARERQGLGGA